MQRWQGRDQRSCGCAPPARDSALKRSQLWPAPNSTGSALGAPTPLRTAYQLPAIPNTVAVAPNLERLAYSKASDVCLFFFFFFLCKIAAAARDANANAMLKLKVVNGNGNGWSQRNRFHPK
jgi:hypothetical protein